MIKFKKYQNKTKESKVYGKWFGRAVHELVEFDDFIQHMANHHCVYSEGTLRGVIIEMEICLRELLLEGKAVRMDDLGIFALSLVNKKGGADKAEDYNANLIENVRMNLFLGRRFRARNLYSDAKFKEADQYVGDGNYYDPDAEAENGATEANGENHPQTDGGGSTNTGGGGNSAGDDFGDDH